MLFELPDQLGSTNIVLDQGTSELVEASTYLPYGADESSYRPTRWASFREDYGFTGKEEDVELGLQYFGNRYLNSSLGRWMSADPLTVHGMGADLNAYAYVHGRFLRAVDAMGLCEDGAVCASPHLNASADPEREGQPGSPGNPVNLDAIPDLPERADSTSTSSPAARTISIPTASRTLIRENEREWANANIHIYNEVVSFVAKNTDSHDPKWAAVAPSVGDLALPSYAPRENTEYWRYVDRENTEKADTTVSTIVLGASVAAPELEGATALSVDVPAPKYGVTFFGQDIADIHLAGGAKTLGKPGGVSWFTPLEDAANVNNVGDAVRASGSARSVTEEYRLAGTVENARGYGLSVPVDNIPLRTPTAADAGGWPHFLEGGHTAMRLGDGGGYLLNNAREFVVPGSTPIPKVAVLFSIENGSWRALVRY